MKRMSYAKLNYPPKDMNPDKIIFVVASRSISFRVNKDILPFLNYDFQEKLQPSEELLYEWKSKAIKEEEYVQRYLKEHPDLKETVKELKNLEKSTNKEVILLCHCIADNFCHNDVILGMKSNKQT